MRKPVQTLTALLLIRSSLMNNSPHLIIPSASVVIHATYEHMAWKYCYNYNGSYTANGYCDEILSRFLRRTKYTCFCPVEHWKNMAPITERAFLKHRVSPHYNTTPLHHCIYFEGQRICVSENQGRHLQKMRGIARKTIWLEKYMSRLQGYGRDGALC